MDDVNSAKWAVFVSLLILTLFFCMLPLCLLRSVRRRIISLLRCFAGGVFMATGLLQLFPEVDEALDKASWGHGYPVAGFVTAFGFFLALTIEQIVLNYKEIEDLRPVPRRYEWEGDLDQVTRWIRRGGSIVGVSDDPLTTSIDGSSDSSDSSDSSLDPVASFGPKFRSLLLAWALTIHSIFEGVAIGLQPDVDSVQQFFLAVGLHKAIIACGLGLNLAQSKMSFVSIITSYLEFSFAAPLGIAIGISEFGHPVDESVVHGVLKGLSCGTFFYVTFFEVLPPESNQGGVRLLKLLAILIGFSVICSVMFLAPDAAPKCSRV